MELAFISDGDCRLTVCPLLGKHLSLGKANLGEERIVFGTSEIETELVQILGKL
jgi:hypothetical protein